MVEKATSVPNQETPSVVNGISAQGVQKEDSGNSNESAH